MFENYEQKNDLRDKNFFEEELSIVSVFDCIQDKLSFEINLFIKNLKVDLFC